MSVSFIRIDDRMIHGQTCTRWAREYPCNGLIAVNDKAAFKPSWASDKICFTNASLSNASFINTVVNAKGKFIPPITTVLFNISFWFNTSIAVVNGEPPKQVFITTDEEDDI